MRGGDDFRAALEAGDFRQLRRISEVAEPHLPRLTDEQAERVMHDARTRSRSITFHKRAWSHRWLVERGYESGLPDRLRPRAEQVCPKVVPFVGIALRTSSPLFASAIPLIREAMEDAVLDAQVHGKLEDSAFVKVRMLEAKQRRLRELFGGSHG